MNSTIIIDEYEGSFENPLENFDLIIDQSYISAANKITILLGLLCFACFLLAVIFVKRSRGMGVVATIMQFVGLFAANKTIVAFSNIDFSSFIVTATGGSVEEAYGNLQEEMVATYMELLPQLLTYTFWGILLTASTVFTLIYVTNLKNCKGKALATVALVFVIFRFILPPVQIMALFNEGSDVALQETWDVIYRISYVIPAVIVAILALLNIKKSQPAVAAAAEPAQAQPSAVVEAPAAVNTPAVEAEQVNGNK